jgi:antitoxin component HigA of HigAB toxin-antitoxin module
MPWETTGGGIGLMNQTDFESYIENQSNAETIANSPIAMGSISASAPAMDAVAASQTAMDAVIASQTALDAVIGSRTALDVVTASQTAMDSMAASQTAMESMAASQTAMDAVTASVIARTALIGSQYAVGSIWSNQMPSETFWNQGSVKDGTNNISWDIELDFSNYNTMEFQTQSNREYSSEYLRVLVDGSTIFEETNKHTWTSRSVDISNYNQATLTFQFEQAWDPVHNHSLVTGPSGDGQAIYFQEDGEPDRNAYFANVTLS